MAKPETTEEKTARLKRLRLAHEKTNPKPKFPPLRLTSIMPFGKHKDFTIQYIMDNHPQYMVWLMDTVSDFELNIEAETYFAELVEDTRDEDF